MQTGNPSGLELCPATARGRSSEALSSKGCLLQSAAWKTKAYTLMLICSPAYKTHRNKHMLHCLYFHLNGDMCVWFCILLWGAQLTSWLLSSWIKEELVELLTCTQPPSLWQSSCGWCTSWWAGTQPQNPGWLTEPAGLQTPGCWRFLDYNLKEINSAAVNVGFPRALTHQADIWLLVGTNLPLCCCGQLLYTPFCGVFTIIGSICSYAVPAGWHEHAE